MSFSFQPLPSRGKETTPAGADKARIPRRPATDGVACREGPFASQSVAWTEERGLRGPLLDLRDAEHRVREIEVAVQVASAIASDAGKTNVPSPCGSGGATPAEHSPAKKGVDGRKGGGVRLGSSASSSRPESSVSPSPFRSP